MVIYVSHEWCSLDHPDPEMQQFSVLQKFLRNLLDGKPVLEEDPLPFSTKTSSNVKDANRAHLKPGERMALPPFESAVLEVAGHREGTRPWAPTHPQLSALKPERGQGP